MIRVEDVTKVYSNGTTAVKGVSFQVDNGIVFGIVGPNGAGKSTTIKIITTLLKPTSGRVFVDNISAISHPFEVRKRIAYLPENVRQIKEFTVFEFAEYFARLYSVNTNARVEELIDRALSISNLHKKADNKVSNLSHGMFRRLVIGVALMTGAPNIILDEPTSGVDVIESMRIRRIVRDQAAMGKAVIFTSHNMLEVEKTCDVIAIMHDGRILLTESVENIVDNYGSVENAFLELIGGDKDE